MLHWRHQQIWWKSLVNTLRVDTINTVVKRCMHISAALQQQYTVITVDQALFCKFVERKWAIPEYQKKLVIQLGGLHISMCFLKVIGNHMIGSGLVEAWVESGLLGPNASKHVMYGKAYERAMHAHKITLQSLWKLLMPFFARLLPEILPRSFPRDIGSCLLFRNCWRPDNIPAITKSW